MSRRALHVTLQQLIVTVWTTVTQQLHTAGISSAHNGPSCPVSEGEGSVSSNCGSRRHFTGEMASKQQLGSHSTR